MRITTLDVDNYRSLKNVHVGDLGAVVVLYGHNDSGKSNILSFLDILFRQKFSSDAPTTVSGQDTNEISSDLSLKTRPQGFWRGEIDDFTDNFFRNSTEPITFTVNLEFARSEILAISGLPTEFKSYLNKNRRHDVLIMYGEIRAGASDRAEILLHKVELNQKVFYDIQQSGKKSTEYLPAFSKVPIGQRVDIFQSIMSQLDDAFLLIPTSRALTTEKELPRGELLHVSPEKLKNWLFQMSLDRDKEKVFLQVLSKFSQEPFRHGRISLSRVGDSEIEAIVEDQYNVKLPIGRKGSGVQQILTILSYIAQSRAKFIGLEEPETNLSPKSQKSIFTDLHNLIHIQPPPISQMFMTTHSPHVAKRNEATRRVVFIDENTGATIVKKPSETDLEDFFQFQ